MKRITKRIGGLLILLMLVMALRPAQAQISVSLPEIVAGVGEEVTIPITVDNLTGSGALAYSLDIQYNSDVLEIDGISKSGTISANAFTSFNTVGDTAYVRAASGSELSGSGTLINLTGTVISEGASPLTFTLVEFENNDGKVPAEGDDGFVTTSDSPPTADDVAAATEEDTPVTINLTGSDPEGADLTFSIVAQPEHGSLSSITDGGDGASATVTYTPDADFEGQDTFTYRVSDGSLTDEATVTIEVAPVQDPPVVNDDDYEVEEDTELSVGAAEGVLANDVDPDGDELVATLETGVASGTLALNTDGSFTYMPGAGFSGTDSFTYTASDGTATSDPATVTITVKAVADTTHLAELSGRNVLDPNTSGASGSISAVLDGTSIAFTGSFTGLSSAVQAVDVHVGPLDEIGDVVLSLKALLTTGGNSGTIEAASNTFELDAETVTALEEGRLYVDIHTTDFPDGEVRGQLRAVPNEAPEASAITSPADGSSFVIGGSEEEPGNGGDALIEISWEDATDPDGHPVDYVYEVAADANFDAVLSTNRFSTADGFVLTVADAATIFDTVTDREPGDIAVGATITLHHRVTTTDGSETTVGAASSVSLTRGQIVSTGGSDVPEMFTLKGNYPNPFNPNTTIEFDLPEAAKVSVQVIDALGRQVMTVPARSVDAGKAKSIDLDASALMSGTYIYRITARFAGEQIVESGTMTLLK